MENAEWKHLVLDVRTRALETEAMAAYAARLARRFTRRDRLTKWVVAAASCAPFVVKLRDTSLSAATWLTSTIPLLAVALPFIDYGSRIKTATSIHEKHASLLPQVRDIWRNVRDESIASTPENMQRLRERLRELEQGIAAAGHEKPLLPDVPSARRAAEKDVNTTQYTPPWEERRYGGGATVVNYRT